MTLSVGDRVGTFSLLRGFADPVSSSELLSDGPILFLFYLFDFSGSADGGWSLELSQFRDKVAEFRRLGITLAGVSHDSPIAHEVFAKQLGLDFKLLSDYHWEAARAFGILREELYGFRPLNTRAVFLVDQDGEILYAWVTEDPNVLPSAGEVLRAATALPER